MYADQSPHAAARRDEMPRAAEASCLAALAWERRGRRRGGHTGTAAHPPGRVARSPVRLRPLEPRDVDLLAGLFDRLSPRSRYLRYIAPVPALPDGQRQALAATDHRDREAVGAFQGGELVGLARYVRSAHDPAEADVSVEVADSHHRRGVATRLVRDLCRRARAQGITRFTATALTENRAIPALLRHLGWPATVDLAGPDMTIAVTLPCAP